MPVKSLSKTRYAETVAPELMKARGYRNVMQVPRLTKIVVSMGISSSMEKDMLKQVQQDLAMLTGQKALVRPSRKSISNFKLREGMPVGLQVTLRGLRMYEFFDRLVNTVLPRLRDFRGIPADGFDGRGNYSFGLTEQSLFPEINPDEVKKTQGMNVTVVTTAKTDEEARDLLRRLGMPFAGGK
jgi:large subunit ribosomal protein L5